MFMRLIIIMMLLMTGISTFAQDKTEVGRCTDSAMHSRLVSMGDALIDQGYKVVSFNLMSMPSGYFVPVAVPVQQGKEYQVFFLANKNYHQYSFALIDDKRNKLKDLKVKSKTGTSNEFTHEFKASYTGTMWIILSQKVRGQEESCGGLNVLER